MLDASICQVSERLYPPYIARYPVSHRYPLLVLSGAIAFYLRRKLYEYIFIKYRS